MTSVVWSPLAVDQVAEAAAFIADDNPEAAVRWAEGVFDAVEQLARFPLSGGVVAELAREDIRELLYGEYRILYRVEESRVLILTVRHGRRLFDRGEIEGA